LNRLRKVRWLLLLAVLAALLLGVSGCGSVQASSWTGMTLVGEKLYVADLQMIQLLNAADGEPIDGIPEDWKDNFLGYFYVAPAVGEGYVIGAAQAPPRGLFAQAKNSVVKLDMETGAALWTFDEAKAPYIEGGVIGVTTDGGEELFVIGNGNGTVYALDVRNGDVVWTFETGHRVWATPLIVDDIVYIGTMDHNLYALHLSNGEEIWRFSVEGAFASTPALQHGVLYIGAFDNRVYAVDAADGSEKWHFPQDGDGESWFWGSPAVDGSSVYAVDVKGNVYALDGESGEEIWHYNLEVPVRAGAVLSEDGSTLLINSQDGGLYALDTADGARRWVAEGDGEGYVSAIVDGDTVYETRIRGSYRVRALELLDGGEGYKELWVFPQETE
jgi:outer membrane protein assembly factor BamB